eukprot:755508-Hanusia_phi.AAC.3
MEARVLRSETRDGSQRRLHRLGAGIYSLYSSSLTLLQDGRPQRLYPNPPARHDAPNVRLLRPQGSDAVRSLGVLTTSRPLVRAASLSYRRLPSARALSPPTGCRRCPVPLPCFHAHPRAQTAVAVKGTRTVGKKDMKFNDATPNINVWRPSKVLLIPPSSCYRLIILDRSCPSASVPLTAASSAC